MKQPLIILAGPTAVGKTSLSVRLAEQINGAVISADSMQAYRHLDIGSAKITKEEMRGIPHYLIDELAPEEEFNVAAFQSMANAYLKKIYREGRIPILVGGTGFYIQSVLYQIDFSNEETNGRLRRDLEAFAAEEGKEALHRKLSEVDPDSACAIHPNNVKRVVRALEYYLQNGETISGHNQRQRQKVSPFNAAYFVLNDERGRLYQSIEARVDLMVARGLLEEVKKLKEMGCHRGMTSMQGLGYKEMLAFLDGEISFEEAVYILKRDTRHFAKRQLTWFHREKDVIWVDKGAFSYREDAMLDYMTGILKERGILR